MARVNFTKRFISGTLEGLDIRVGMGAPLQDAERRAARLRAMAQDEVHGKDVITKAAWLVVPGSVELVA
jgi:hypothetical protein